MKVTRRFVCSGRGEQMFCVCAADGFLERRGDEGVSRPSGTASVRALSPQGQTIREGLSITIHWLPHPDQR
jgi:hypothetical protein